MPTMTTTTMTLMMMAPGAGPGGEAQARPGPTPHPLQRQQHHASGPAASRIPRFFPTPRPPPHLYFVHNADQLSAVLLVQWSCSANLNADHDEDSRASGAEFGRVASSEPVDPNADIAALAQTPALFSQV